MFNTVTFNTTTIPTHYFISTMPPNFFSALLSGCFLIMPFVVGIMHIIKRYEEENGGEEESDEEDDSGEEEEEEKYIKELQALTDRELTEKDYKELETKMVRELIGIDADTIDEKRNVEIIMSYHKESETFWYYTNDLKEISYKTLEAVARKFVIEHNCKRLYLESKREKTEKNIQIDKEGGGGLAERTGNPPKSVFAQFKKYNTGTKGGLPNFGNDNQSTEQSNHFRYKGKLYHYEESLKKMTEKNVNPQLDYAAYKLIAKKDN